MIKCYKAEASEAINEVIRGSLDITEGSINDYKKETLDWSWNKIMEEDD